MDKTDFAEKWKNACRLCLLDDGIKLSIFEGEGIQKQIAPKIRTCFPILIYIGDPLPKMICHKCLFKLDTVYEFRQKCLETHAILKKHLLTLKQEGSVRKYLDLLEERQEVKQKAVGSIAQPKPPDPRKDSNKPLPKRAEQNTDSENLFQKIFVASSSSSDVFLDERVSRLADREQQGASSSDSQKCKIPAEQQEPVPASTSLLNSKYESQVPARSTPSECHRPAISFPISHQVPTTSVADSYINTSTEHQSHVSSASALLSRNARIEYNRSSATSLHTNFPLDRLSQFSSATIAGLKNIATKHHYQVPSSARSIPMEYHGQVPSVSSIAPITHTLGPTSTAFPPLNVSTERRDRVPATSTYPPMNIPVEFRDRVPPYAPMNFPSELRGRVPSASKFPPMNNPDENYRRQMPPVSTFGPMNIPFNHRTRIPATSAYPSMNIRAEHHGQVPSTSTFPMMNDLVEHRSRVPPLNIPVEFRGRVPPPSTFPPISIPRELHGRVSSISTFTPPKVPSNFAPTNIPTSFPPTNIPTSFTPVNIPTSFAPTNIPTFASTNIPTSFTPTNIPTSFAPTNIPTSFASTNIPTSAPTNIPTSAPTNISASNFAPRHIPASDFTPMNIPIEQHSKVPEASSFIPENVSFELNSQVSITAVTNFIAPKNIPIKSQNKISATTIGPLSKKLEQEVATAECYDRLDAPSDITIKEEPLDEIELEENVPFDEQELMSAVQQMMDDTFETKQNLSCPSCRSTFNDETQLQNHDCRPSAQWSCENCNKIYSSEEMLHKHQKYFCTKKKSGCECKICGKLFTTELEMTEHQAAHLRVCASLLEEDLHSCIYCGKKFAAKAMLEMHKKSHSQEKSDTPSLHQQTVLLERRFQCPHCHRSYTKRSNLSLHIKNIHFVEKIVPNMNSLGEEEDVPQWKKQCSCKYCGSVCADSSELWIHMLQEHSSTGPMHQIRCDICGRSFEHKGAYENHRKTHGVKLTCKVCGKLYATPKALRAHEVNKHDLPKTRYKCRLCNESFTTRSGLLIHGRIHDLEKGKGVDAPLLMEESKVMAEPLSCTLCSETFHTPAGLLSHMKNHTLSSAPQDSTSDGVDEDQQQQQQEQEQQQQQQEQEEQQEEQQQQQEQEEQQQETCEQNPSPTLICKICCRQFSSKEALERHIKTHATGKHIFYPCSVCGKKFVTESTFKAHVATHSVSRSFHCQHCNKIFFKEEVFKSHTCEGREKEACAMCGILLSGEELVNHMCVENISAGCLEQEVKCKICLAAFRSLKALNNHMRMHNREQNSSDGKARTSCIKLANGMYQCKICGKVTASHFGASGHWKVHMNPQHSTPSKPYCCPFCGRKYTSETGLYTHISAEHPESPP